MSISETRTLTAVLPFVRRQWFDHIAFGENLHYYERGSEDGFVKPDGSFLLERLSSFSSGIATTDQMQSMKQGGNPAREWSRFWLVTAEAREEYRTGGQLQLQELPPMRAWRDLTFSPGTDIVDCERRTLGGNLLARPIYVNLVDYPAVVDRTFLASGPYVPLKAVMDHIKVDPSVRHPECLTVTRTWISDSQSLLFCWVPPSQEIFNQIVAATPAGLDLSYGVIELDLLGIRRFAAANN